MLLMLCKHNRGITDCKILSFIYSLLMDLSEVRVEPLTTTLNEHNIAIIENHGLDGTSGFWWLKFKFDFNLETGIVIRLTNFKYNSTGDIWTLEIEKCLYLGIREKKDLVSFDIVDQLINIKEFERIQQFAFSDEKLREYLNDNVIPLITKKIKYTKYKPQIRFFLSHKSQDKPIMRTFKGGLKFLGYSAWIDEDNMPTGAYLKAALKVSVDNCDCFIAWLNEDYLNSDYCKAELLYAKKLGKIILPFGVYKEIKTHLQEDEELKFLEELLISNPNDRSFFEVLRRIDDTLFEFEKMALPSR